MPRVVILLQKITLGSQPRCFMTALCGLKRSSCETRASCWGLRRFAKSCKRLEKGKSNACQTFNYQELVQAELKYYKSKSHKYRKLEDWFKKRLEIIWDKYASSNNNSVMHVDGTEYFEDDGCIYRKLKNGSPKVVLCLDQLQFLQTKDDQFQRIRVSPDQRYLASSIRTLSEESTCVVVKLDPKPVVAHVLPQAFSFEWATDNCLFYTILEKLRSQQVFRLLLEDLRAASEMVYKESDTRFFVELTCTKDGKFITINSNSKNSSEVWLIDRMHPLEEPKVVQRRLPELIYHVEHWKNQLCILTNFGASKEYRLMKAPISSPGMQNWKTIYAVKEKHRLIDMELFDDHCVMILKCYGYLYLHVFSLKEAGAVKSIQLSSPVQPPVSLQYSMDEDELYIKDDEAWLDITKDYKVTRLKAPSMDGTLVPISVFHKTTLNQMNENPLLVHVYGAYGMDLNVDFKPEQMMLLEDGWILAYCHVRGGGELGLSWHKAGRLDKKHIGVDDLRACLCYLHTMGYSNPRRTALKANSAGGVLVGSLCNVSPDFIRAVVLRAPFLDVLSTMLDPSLPLTKEDQEEWGNPLSDQRLFKYIQAYCPYQNIKQQNYPSVFITAYQGDQRVPLSGLLRYTTKLRNAVAANKCNTTDKDESLSIILDIRPGDDHFGPTDWEQSLHEVARHYAFLYKELELDP
ncbi:prolyl endopeptidase-like isoform X2 [Pristis pectinata]|uniref:prolyl endopeptidase-like isoform X2 n=1 Tax=Pristis pectinata TaxID=685728 RepID=UPI00223E3E3E|nr:prolyl endopeptidase-like isoform X2 [Pristis pectinata]